MRPLVLAGSRRRWAIPVALVGIGFAGTLVVTRIARQDAAAALRPTFQMGRSVLSDQTKRRSFPGTNPAAQRSGPPDPATEQMSADAATRAATAAATVAKRIAASLPPSVPQLPAASNLGTHPSTLTDVHGEVWGLVYDSDGRLMKLRLADDSASAIRVSYGQEGRIVQVSFGNGYSVGFDYSSDGTEHITDGLGDALTRSQAVGGRYVLRSASDPNSTLLSAMARIEALFAHLQPVAGLNPASNGAGNR